MRLGTVYTLKSRVLLVPTSLDYECIQSPLWSKSHYTREGCGCTVWDFKPVGRDDWSLVCVRESFELRSTPIERDGTFWYRVILVPGYIFSTGKTGSYFQTLTKYVILKKLISPKILWGIITDSVSENKAKRKDPPFLFLILRRHPPLNTCSHPIRCLHTVRILVAVEHTTPSFVTLGLEKVQQFST